MTEPNEAGRNEPWIEELLDADRSLPAVEPAQADRIFARVEGSIASEAAAGAASTAAAAATKPLIVVVAAVAFAVGGAVGYATHAATTSPKVEERVVTKTVYVHEPAPFATPSASVEPPPPRVEPSSSAPKTVPPPPRSAAAEAPVGEDVALARENALLSRAQSALSRGRPDEALVALDEHNRAFPRGRFAEECDALRVQALVRAGRRDEAEAAAQRFFAKYPGSLSTRVVRDALRQP